MIKIVYSSNTGYTKRLAKILGEKAGLQVMDLKSAKNNLKPEDEIIYFGWLFANNIKDYKKAAKLFKVKAVCAVGLADSSDQLISTLKNQNNTENIPLFYMRGGYDTSKLKGFNKFVMKMFAGMLNKKSNKTSDEENMLKIIKNGADFVSESSVEPVVQWLNK